jgi:hypothetical protein
MRSPGLCPVASFVVKSVEASVCTVGSKLMSKNNTVNVTLCRLQRAVTICSFISSANLEMSHRVFV